MPDVFWKLNVEHTTDRRAASTSETSELVNAPVCATCPGIVHIVSVAREVECAPSAPRSTAAIRAPSNFRPAELAMAKTRAFFAGSIMPTALVRLSPSSNAAATSPASVPESSAPSCWYASDRRDAPSAEEAKIPCSRKVDQEPTVQKSIGALARG